MKYFKSLGMLAVAAAALMALATSASADYVTTTTGGATQTSEIIHAVSEGGHVRLNTSLPVIECSSTVQGKVETHTGGTSGDAAEGAITALTFTSCTNSWHVTTAVLGRLWIDWTSGHNGVVTSSGTTVTATRFFVPCNFETKHTKLGTVTGGSPATLHIEARIPLESSSSELCGRGDVIWEGNYITTSALYVANGH
jgi:hypothetical protein